MAMRIVVSALVALPVVAGITGPSSALEPQNVYEQQERRSAAPLDREIPAGRPWSTPVKPVAVMVVVVLALIAGAVASVHADRVPSELWERLDREPY